MAKAEITLPNGTKVQIDGTVVEVAELVARFSPLAPSKAQTPATARRTKKPQNKASARRIGLSDLIDQLATEGYFKSKRTIGDVKKKLEEKGHIYPMVRLSTPLLRLTRNRTLRRFKEGGAWVYVN